MPIIQTRDEAITSLDQAFGTWSGTWRGVWQQAVAQAAAACSEIDGERRHRATRVAALEAALSAASEEQRVVIAAQLERARRSLDGASAAAAGARRASEAVRAEVRRVTTASDAVVSRAQADLRRRLGSLSDYRRYSGTSTTSLNGHSGPTSGGVLPAELTEVPLDDLDYANNPLVGEFGKGGASKSDYRWAAETWDTVVRPGVGRGMSRDDFAARDAERGAPPFRRTADVHDLFLGDSDRIVLSRTAAGKLDIVNGRHRIAVARELGITHLPARIVE
jgi:hypothetical protein